MKVSKRWLNRFFDAPLPSAEALAEALTFHAFEIDGVEQVGGPRQGDEASDEVLDVKVTPNRGHDCLSHRGIAKELSAILKRPLAHDPFAGTPVFAPVTNEVSVVVDTPLCKRYIAAYIKGIKVGPSPQWLRERLEAIGQRSINNVVDATNFVMCNTGQPLHAFDAQRLGSLALGVRLAREGEEIEGLDQKQYALKPSMLVVTAADRPVGIAGIKGGMPAAIDEHTTYIVIESANFDGISVRKTAQALKLRTDASARFEQELSPELAARGMQNMMEFAAHLLGGEVAGFVDVYPAPQKPTHARVTVQKVNEVLGTELTGAEVADAFTRLGLPYKEEGGVFEVHVPQERLDLSIPEDLVEEVGRIVGYDKVPATPLPIFDKAAEVNPLFFAAEQKREELVAQGYSEIFTSVFADKGERQVANKIGGEKPCLRASLLPGLEEALFKNKPNKDLLGLKEIKLFEIGTVWRGGKELVMVGTLSEKEEAKEAELKPVEAAQYNELPLSTTARYQSFSRYPYIVRDIAMWVPAGTDEKATAELIQQEAGELAYKVMQFDRFEKEGRVSLAYRVIFQSFERTLTDAEANAAMQKVAAAAVSRGWEVR